MKAYFYCRVAHDDSFSLERQAEHKGPVKIYAQNYLQAPAE